MATILHRLTIDAPPEDVHELIATAHGIEQWWTGRPVEGDDGPGGELSVYFGERDRAAATFEIVEQSSDRVAWRCAGGPQDWIGTRISFAFRARDDGGTTLLFDHEGWSEESEFMHGCSTNWCAYLMSLKSGVEGRGFHPYPDGEISRWT